MKVTMLSRVKVYLKQRRALGYKVCIEGQMLLNFARYGVSWSGPPAADTAPLQCSPSPSTVGSRFPATGQGSPAQLQNAAWTTRLHRPAHLESFSLGSWRCGPEARPYPRPRKQIPPSPLGAAAPDGTAPLRHYDRRRRKLFPILSTFCVRPRTPVFLHHGAGCIP